MKNLKWVSISLALVSGVTLGEGGYHGSYDHGPSVESETPAVIQNWVQTEYSCQSVPRTGKNLGGNSVIPMTVTAPVNRYEIVPTNVKINVPYIRCRAPKETPISVTIPTTTPERRPSGGADDSWHGYFNTSKSDARIKADKLAGAIKGMGKKAAYRIVTETSLLNTRPQTWKEFKEEIKAAGQAIHEPDLYAHVIEQNGSSNHDSLGYATHNENQGPGQVTVNLPPIPVWKVGDSSDMYWNMYWNSDRASYMNSARASYLSSALGIDSSDAEKIVNSGFFHTRPRSWQQFVDDVMKVQNDLHIGIARKLLVENYYDTRNRLGFYNADFCREEGSRELSWTEDQTHTTFINNRTRNYEVRISGAPLLGSPTAPPEQETVQVCFGGKGKDVSENVSVSSRYNNYGPAQLVSKEGGTRVYNVQGRRIQIPSDLSQVAVKSWTDPKTREIWYAVTDNNYDPDRGKFYVNVQTTEKKHWYSTSYTSEGNVTVPITGQTTWVDSGAKAESGKAFSAVYRVGANVGNPYYDANWSEPGSGDLNKFYPLK